MVLGILYRNQAVTRNIAGTAIDATIHLLRLSKVTPVSFLSKSKVGIPSKSRLGRPYIQITTNIRFTITNATFKPSSSKGWFSPRETSAPFPSFSFCTTILDLLLLLAMIELASISSCSCKNRLAELV